MARTVEDAALLLRAIACYDSEDPASVRAELHSAAQQSHRGTTRIGIPERLIELAQIDEDVERAFRAAMDVLTGLNMQVHAVDLPAAQHTKAIYGAIVGTEALAYHAEALKHDQASYGRGTRDRLLQGLTYSGVDYVQAQRTRMVLAREMTRVMTDVDVIAMPTVPTVAPTWDAFEATDASVRPSLTRLCNLTGQPSLSVPCGSDPGGLPIGLMLCGRSFGDELLLDVAAAYERATPWHQMRVR
jgi:aspartyl-tRNA(Asn)/glutamyl-tRNA(Gln) amidotransferase subunit A